MSIYLDDVPKGHLDVLVLLPDVKNIGIGRYCMIKKFIPAKGIFVFLDALNSCTSTVSSG